MRNFKMYVYRSALGDPEKRTDAVLGGIANLMASPRNRVLRGHVENARTALDKDRECQWQGPRVRRFGGNSLVAILPHYLTTSGCHPRPQFHELHPQVLQGALVVGDLTLDIRQLEFK